jgi:soluble P-type ATPase
LLSGVKTRLTRLAPSLRIHVVTADTFGKARSALRGLACKLSIVERGAEAAAKAAYVRRLGAKKVACIGNGRNDRLMLRAARLGIAVIQTECTSVETVAAADVLAPSVCAALDLFLRPRRLVATLRS